MWDWILMYNGIIIYFLLQPVDIMLMPFILMLTLLLLCMFLSMLGFKSIIGLISQFDYSLVTLTFENSPSLWSQPPEAAHYRRCSLLRTTPPAFPSFLPQRHLGKRPPSLGSELNHASISSKSNPLSSKVSQTYIQCRRSDLLIASAVLYRICRLLREISELGFLVL
ncbi:hypothetical protein L1987_19695 [Smallanthus sonchifolius]|uniref:Uncharacterized protein n=1 Tax=Smallanthus sonchifolius TaxID=185202 RepID=A0ACB9ISQ3_9ASTR|nr:hypothetical protein L1987_19695 [Smallanthus sonchifolius]